MRVLEAFRLLKPKSRQRSSSRKRDERDEYNISSPEALKEPREPGLYRIPIDAETCGRAGEQRYEVDIVAIHGLDGSPWGTWTHKDGTFWLRDMLPTDIPGARIFTYSYPSQVLWSRSEAALMEYAQTLLENLRNQRRNQQRRPIVFLAHSLGGIVCKEALIKAKNDPRFSDLLESTVGIVFFGTPHRGAETKFGVFMGNSINTTTIERVSGRVRTDLLGVLESNSVKLREIDEAFRHISPRFEIVTVYETEIHATLGRLVVNQSSAQMGAVKERKIAGYGSHTEICRFRRSNGLPDQGYQSVLCQIIEICESELSLTASEKAYYEQFNDPAVDDYTFTISQPVRGTCEWILKGQKYKLWAQEPRPSIFWLTGHAGSGKSVLAKFITQHLEEDASSRHDTVICSFFCNNELSALKDAKSLLRRIIFQLLKKHSEPTKKIMCTSDDDSSGRTMFESYDRLWSILMIILRRNRSRSVHIVIDALDECEETTRDRFMNDLAKLVDHSRLSSINLKIWITSRPYLSINEYFKTFVPQRLALEDNGDDTDRDLRLVIKERVQKLADKLQLKHGTVSGIEDHLIENADRTFLWVQFALELLERSLRTAPGDFRRVLAGLPRKLEDVYIRFLHEIRDEDKDFARKVLFAVIGGFRPLTLEELNVMISMSRSQQGNCYNLAHLEKDYLHENIRVDIERTLGPLIKVSKARVYLVHLSLKEFLCQPVERTPGKVGPQREYINISDVHLMLAFACMAYLSFDDFTQNIYSKARSHSERQSLALSETSVQRTNSRSWSDASSDVGEEDEPVDGYIFGNHRETFDSIDPRVRAIVQESYALFEYASLNWVHHFAKCQDLSNHDLRSLAIRLTDRCSERRYSNWLRLYLAGTIWEPGDPWSWDQFTIAGYFGHHVSLETLLDQMVSVRPESLSLALHWASRNGHEKCVVSLLKTNVVPDSCKPSTQSALCSAAVNGHTGIVKALATDPRVDVNFKGWLDICPLQYAAIEGHFEIVDFLLEKERVDPNMQDECGQTPVAEAIDRGHKEIALRLAKDRRVNVNYTDIDGLRLIDRAAKQGKEEETALLLQFPCVDVNTPCPTTGRPLLAEAAMCGHTTVVEQLLQSRKLDKTHSHKDKDGRSAISLAAGNGFSNTVTLLLKYRIPGIDEKDNVEEWTPLFWALKSPRNRSATVKCLLDSSQVDPNSRDRNGRTALGWSVQNDDEPCLRLLLSTEGIDPLISDNNGLTPLDLARSLQDRSHKIALLETYSHSGR